MNTSQTVRFLGLSLPSLDKAKNRAKVALVKKICASCLFIGFTFPLVGQTSNVRDVSISSPQTLLFTGNGDVLKNPERGLSLKAGYFDLFVDQYNYDGSILLDLKSSNLEKQVTVANRESFSGINMTEFGTQHRTQDTISNVLYRLIENEPVIDPTKTGYSLKFPNKSMIPGVKPYSEIQITNCSFNGNTYPLLKFRFHQEWVYRSGQGWVVDFGIIVYTNDTPAQIITSDNNPAYDQIDEIKFSYDGNNVLYFVSNVGNIINIGINQTSQMNVDVSSNSHLFTFESIGTDGVLRTDLGFNTTDFNSDFAKEWHVDISTNISHDSFFIDLEENPISISNVFSFDTLTNLLSISDAYFNETIVDQATNKGIELPASYINTNGISLVELEQYIHFSENNIANNHQILDQESINKAKAKFDQLEALGLKSHLILNSDFRMSLENGGTTIAIPEFLEFQYLLNMIDTLNGALYSDDEKLVAFSHLGLMNEHNDFNYYRHSPTWLNHHSKYFGLNGNLSPEGILSENRLNNEGSLRASDQKSAWKYYSASSPKTGYPFSSADNQMQYIREEVIDKVTNVFEDKKVLLEEVIAWNHKMTFPQAYPNDQYDSNGNLGFYDGAFGTTYDHLYTIGDNPQKPPFSHDFTNIDKRDLYVLGKHSDQFWVHGEMPVYMNDNQFDSTFSFESNWVNNDQYNVDVFKGMSTVSATEQDALLAAKKLRMFNFSSFDITLNNSENFGKNIYESTNPNNGVGSIDRWRTTNINQTQADNLDLPYSTNYFNQTRTVFDYIRDHLGYRLEMKSLSSAIVNDTLKLSAEIQNRGFSAPKNKRDVYFVILDDNGNEIEKIDINSDWRTWRSDSTLDVKKQSLTSTNYSDYSLSNDLLPSSIQFYSHKIEAEINTSLLQENTQYTIALWMPDMDATLQTEAFAVKLANDEIEIGSRGENLLSRFVYKPTFSIDSIGSVCENDLVTLSASQANSYLWSTGDTTQSTQFTADVTESYSVIGTMPNGSQLFDTIEVIVNDLPIVNISGPVSGCEGDLITLTANGADEYLWSNGETSSSVSFVLSTNTTITVTGTTNGCSSNIASTTVNLNTTPIVNISGPVSGCEGDLITLTAIGADSYIWNNGATTSSISFVLNSDSTFSVTGTTNGCSSTQTNSTVTLNSIPVVNITGPASGCDGELITLTAAGANSYLWSNGSTTPSISFALNTDSVLSVIGTTNGCSSIQANATVNLNSSPNIIVSGPTSGCMGDEITFIANGADSYQWSNGATTPSVSFVLSSDSSLSVTGTTNGCVSTPINVSVNLNATPVVNISGPVSGCDGDLITLTASGADSYVWSNGATTPSISFVLNSDSTLSVTGTTNGCSSSQETTTVNLNATPTVSITGPVSGCDGDLITLTASGADSYVWSTGETTNAITFTFSDEITISVEGNNTGCGIISIETHVIDEAINCQVNNIDMEITKPDLSLRTVVKGEDFDLNVNLNINGQITDPSTNLIYTLSQDTLASNDDLFLGSEMISGINNLNGQTIEVIKNIQLPQGLLGMWNVLVQLDSDELIEESDEENNLIIQPISIITPEQNFANNSEFHSVSIQASHADDWHEIQMSNTYSNPVIIIGGLTLNSNQSVSGVRIKDVQSNSFKMKIEEWDYLDGSHSFEDVNYMIIEAGEYTMSNGKKIIAEKTTVNSYYNTINISPSQKLLFAQTMSFNSTVPVTTRIKKNWMNFEIKLQREEAKLQNHPNEDVGYVVFDNGIDFVQLGAYQLRTTTTYASYRYRSLYSIYPTEGDILIAGLSTTYDNNTATVRYKKSGNRYRFKVQEERSQDNEMYHFYEQISVLYLKPILAKVANVSENITEMDMVENNYVEKSFDIFPNPTNQQFTITLEETDEVEYYEMEIYDTMGQLLKRNEKVGHYTSVDVTDLPSGSYIIVLKSDKINMHQTLIITE